MMQARGSKKGMGSSKAVIRAKNLFLFQISVFPWTFVLDLAQSHLSVEFHRAKA